MSEIGEWVAAHADTLGVTSTFTAIGSGMSLWVRARGKPMTAGEAGTVIVAGQVVSIVVALFLHGHLGWPWWLAPGPALISGILGLVVIRVVMRGGDRIEERAADLADKGIDLLPGDRK